MIILNEDWVKMQKTRDLEAVVIEWVRLDIEFENICSETNHIPGEDSGSADWLGRLTIPKKPTFYWAKRIFEQNEVNKNRYSWNEYNGITEKFEDVFFDLDDLILIVKEIRSRNEYGKLGRE